MTEKSQQRPKQQLPALKLTNLYSSLKIILRRYLILFMSQREKFGKMPIQRICKSPWESSARTSSSCSQKSTLTWLERIKVANSDRTKSRWSQRSSGRTFTFQTWGMLTLLLTKMRSNKQVSAISISADSLMRELFWEGSIRMWQRGYSLLK